MTDQEKRIAIAEFCGWKRIRLGTQSKDDPEPRGWLPPRTNDWRNGRHELPKFTSDLNAMNEAELKLDVNQLNAYADALDKVCVPTHICALTHWASVVTADASQRATAFLIAIGKL
jgi:hypothetical protein